MVRADLSSNASVTVICMGHKHPRHTFAGAFARKAKNYKLFCADTCLPDLEWKMIYVGSAESAEYDQVLDSIMVGPIPVGINKFVFSVRFTYPIIQSYTLASYD